MSDDFITNDKNYESHAFDRNHELTEYVKGAINGDREELSLLCQRILNPVLFRVMRDVDNKVDAEDITQEIMLRVSVKISKLKDPNFFRLWLSRIISNEISRYMKRDRNHDVSFEDIDDYRGVPSEDEDTMPMNMMINREGCDVVLGLIKNLPKQQQTVIMLMYYEGMTLTEIADTLGLAKTSVSTHLKRAHEKLKKELRKAASSIGGRVAELISYGAMLSEFLQIDSEIFAIENAVWVSEVWERCEPYVAAGAAVASGAAVITVEKVALATSTVAAGAVGVGTAYAAGAKGISSLAVAMAVVAAIAITAGIVFSQIFVTEEQTTRIAAGTVLSVEMTDGTNYGETYIDVETTTGLVHLVMRPENSYWQLFLAQTNETLYRGTTLSELDAAMENLQAGDYRGEVFIHFQLEDGEGNPVELYRSFWVD